MSNKVLPNDAIKILFENLAENEKKILLLYKSNVESIYTQEDVKRNAFLSTNDARVSLYKLEATLFIDRETKGRGNAYKLSDNGKKVLGSIRQK